MSRFRLEAPSCFRLDITARALPLAAPVQSRGTPSAFQPLTFNTSSTAVPAMDRRSQFLGQKGCMFHRIVHQSTAKGCRHLHAKTACPPQQLPTSGASHSGARMSQQRPGKSSSAMRTAVLLPMACYLFMFRYPYPRKYAQGGRNPPHKQSLL